MMQPPAPGQRLGRFLIERVLGRGGMGVVYLARDDALDRPVALKLVAGDLAWNPEFLARFEREARSAARLSHPNIVHVYDVGQDGPARFLVMEYVPGVTLADRIRNEGALTPSQVVSLARQVGAALDQAHAAGVLHRDVKPGNVMLAPNGRAVLTDFGLAFAAQDSRLTSAGLAVGSPLYMSPEQAAGQQLDHRSDLYSLAVMLYEALAGRPPFNAPSPPAVLVQHMTATPPPITAIRPDLPPEVGLVFARALAKAPAERYNSGAELAEALAAALSPVVSTQVQQVAPPSSTGRLVAWGVAAGLVGAILLGAGLTLVERMSQDRGTPTPTTVVAGLTPTPSAPSGKVQVPTGPSPAAGVVPSPVVQTIPTPTIIPPTPTQPRPTATVPRPTPTPGEAQEVEVALAEIGGPWGRAEWDTVIDRLAPVQARYPGNPALREKLYAAYVEKGRALEIMENPVEARRPYAAAVRLEPNRPEARGRLQAIDPVKRAFAWRNYRWAPGVQVEDEFVRGQQSGEVYVIQAKKPQTVRAAWNSTAVQVGPSFVAKISGRLLNRPGGLDIALFETAQSWAHHMLRVVRADDGGLWTLFTQARPSDPSVVDYLVSLGPNPGFLPPSGQLDQVQVDVRGLSVTATVNGQQVWSGQVRTPTGIVAVGAVSYSQPDAGVALNEYRVYEP